MKGNIKYTKYSGLMLIALIVVAISSSVFLSRSNFVGNPLKNEVEKAQNPSSSAVLGTSSSTSGGAKCMDGDVCDYNVMINYQPLCTINDAGVDMTTGDASEGQSFVSVRQNAQVEVFQVTVPQVLLQGSKAVDDSRKVISYDYPVYRDSQHIILDDEARRTCAPGVDCAEYDRIAGKSDEPFGVHAFAEVKNADAGGFGGDGKAVLYSVPSLKSSCPKVQKAKANPKVSAQYSYYLDLKQQAPGDHLVTRNFGAVDCVRSNPNGINLSEAKNWVSCVTDVKPTDFLVSAVFEIEQWLDCLANKANCEEYRIFAIRLDALYGGVMKCAKPDCEIRYFDYQKLQSIAPGDAISQVPDYITPDQISTLTPVTEPYYIMTPCKIRINKGGISPVPCLWDVSPYQRQWEIQKAAYMPKDPTMPQTWDEYWNNYVVPELKHRSNSCS